MTHEQIQNMKTCFEDDSAWFSNIPGERERVLTLRTSALELISDLEKVHARNAELEKELAELKHRLSASNF